MKLKVIISLLSLFTLFPFPGLVFAQDAVPVSASIPEQSFNPPTLISPADNSVTNNPQTPFSWERPDPLPATSLDHYDLYIDGVIFAQGISDSLALPSEYYFYIVERTDDIFKVYPKTSLSEGYHTWKVIAYTSAGTSAESTIWTFYVDSIDPFIKLTSVDTSTLNWDSRDLTTIPSEELRYIYVTEDPLLKGEVEPGANLQFTLLCPIDITDCTSLTQTYNYPDGKFQHRFYDLLPNRTYTVYLTVTDAAGNVTNFPVFYLIHLSGFAGIFPPPPGISTLIPEGILPTPPVLPTPITGEEPLIVPETFIPELYTPAEFLPVPPIAPTPPPPVPEIAPRPLSYLPLLMLLLVFGLPLHLALSQFATATGISHTHKFLLILLYPFIGKKKYMTQPFTTIDIHDTLITYKPFSITISDILGQYSLPEPIPKTLFVKATHSERDFKPAIIPGEVFRNICLYLIPTPHKSKLQRLRSTSMTVRSIPLSIGILTSATALVLIPSHGLLIYLYLCLQATFSEYVYPKISR